MRRRVQQETTGHRAASSLAASLGARLRGDVQLTQSVGVFLLADGRAQGVKLKADRGARLGVRPLYAATAGFRAAF